MDLFKIAQPKPRRLGHVGRSNLLGKYEPAKTKIRPRSRFPPLNLINLPAELLLEIGEYLAVDDLLNLRVASKQSNARWQAPHENALYWTRTYFLSRPSLEILKSVANSRLGSKIKHLRLDVMCPCTDPNVSLEIVPKCNAAGADVIASEEIEEVVEDIFESHTLGKNTELLTNSLEKMPNLITIEFFNSQGWAPSIRNLNVYFPRFGFRYVPFSLKLDYISKRWNMGLDFSTYYFSVLEAVARSKSLVKNIKLHVSIVNPIERARGVTFGMPEYPFQFTDEYRELYSSNLKKIRRLELILDAANPNHRDKSSYDEQPTFCDFICLMRKSLQKLKVSYDTMPSGTRIFNGFDFRFAEPLPNFPRLRSVHLENINCERVYLKDFLEKIKSTLIDLRLMRVLTRDPVKDWYKMLKLFQSDFRLQRFYLYALMRSDAFGVSIRWLPPIERKGSWYSYATFQVSCSKKQEMISTDRRVLEVLNKQDDPTRFWDLLMSTSSIYDNSDDEFAEYAVYSPIDDDL